MSFDFGTCTRCGTELIATRMREIAGAWGSSVKITRPDEDSVECPNEDCTSDEE